MNYIKGQEKKTSITKVFICCMLLILIFQNYEEKNDGIEQIQTCDRDNTECFATNGTGNIDLGATLCSTEENTTTTWSWANTAQTQMNYQQGAGALSLDKLVSLLLFAITAPLSISLFSLVTHENIALSFFCLFLS